MLSIELFDLTPMQGRNPHDRRSMKIHRELEARHAVPRVAPGIPETHPTEGINPVASRWRLPARKKCQWIGHRRPWMNRFRSICMTFVPRKRKAAKAIRVTPRLVQEGQWTEPGGARNRDVVVRGIDDLHDRLDVLIRIVYELVDAA